LDPGLEIIKVKNARTVVGYTEVNIKTFLQKMELKKSIVRVKPYV